jgi:hypothetical protein
MTHIRTSRNRAAAEWFGDGSDGNATISGASTLAADKYYANLTIQAGAAITTTGYRIFVSGILDLTAAPTASFKTNGNNGVDAFGYSGGAAPTAVLAGSLPIGQRGLAGKDSTDVAGVNSTATAGITSCGGQGAQGGYGGDSLSFAGGNPTAFNTHLLDYAIEPAWLKLYYTAAVQGGAGGQGGCSGAGNVGYGGACGSGGSGGNIMWICARTIKRGTNVNTAIFQANGGNGGIGDAGDNNTGGGGGGAGGGGGFILIVCEALEGSTIVDAVSVSGGDGGLGGAGRGTGSTAAGGGGGAKGATALLKANAGGFVYTAPGTPVAPIDGTAAGRTGEAGLVDL